MSPLNHLRALRRKSPAVSRAGKRGEGGAWGGPPPLPFPTRSGSPHPAPPPGLETLPRAAAATAGLEDAPSPATHTPTDSGSQGKGGWGRGNRFQGRKGAAAPLPAPGPAHPCRAPASLGVTASSPWCPRGEGSGPGCRRRPGHRRGAAAARSGSLGRTRGLATPPSAAQLTAAPASPPRREFPGPRP